ncbi:MAG: hypothetical protein RML15_03475 [Bacteroidota bacterium]|nr:hypothetical protein [Candidatus Kapabacteria bacterium]MCS7301919.1 hypothetical protein [Candidatus Kapabacteria bacterium]MCX7936625.1 hypothetical protein [Chlorobiota bacterium]MDW8074818.1 hypothetical protein [Bacteroidota bacterium]MDW8271457.1 hypothetical protein [Bacteroidota bacterium]
MIVIRFLVLLLACILPPTGEAQWQLLSRKEGADVHKIYSSPSGAVYVQLASGMKIFRSYDGGISWVELSLPVSGGIGYFAPCADTLGLEALVFVTKNTFYRSTDYGRSWQEIAPPLLLSPEENIVDLIGTRFGKLVILVQTATGVAVAISRDQGNTASRVGELPAGTWHVYQAHDSSLYCYGNGLYHIDWHRLSIQRRSSAQFEALCSAQEYSGGAVELWAAQNAALVRSTDRGNTWVNAMTGILTPLATPLLISTHSGTLFCLTQNSSGDSTYVYRRFAGGAAWSLVARGAFRAKDAIALPNGTLLVATQRGVFSSEESGVFWSNSSSGIQGIGLVCAAYEPSGLLIAVGTTGELYRSVNHGLSWTTVASFPGNTTVTDILIAPLGTIVVGTSNGLWWSIDGGAQFQRCSTTSGPITEPIVSVAAFKGALVAATSGGAYMTLDNRTWTAVSVPLPINETIVAVRANDSIAVIATTRSIHGVERLVPLSLRTFGTLGGTILRCDIADDGTIGVMYDSSGTIVYARLSRDGSSRTIVPLPRMVLQGFALTRGGHAWIAGKELNGCYSISRQGITAIHDTTIPEPVLFLRRQRSGDLLAATAYGAVYRMAADSILSVESGDLNGVTIAPNPVRNALVVSSNSVDTIFECSLVGPWGETIASVVPMLGSPVVVLNVESVPSGWYFVRVRTMHGTFTKPVVIVR